MNNRKYKIRKTGEIVEVIVYSSFPSYRQDSDSVSYIDSKGIEHFHEHLNIYWDFEPILNENETWPYDELKRKDEEDHWRDFRNNAASQIMQGILETDTSWLKVVADEVFNILPKHSVRLANELVKELKKNKDY